MSKLATVESLWNMLDDIEGITRDEARHTLADWEAVVRATVEAGCLAPMVPAKNHGMPQFIAAGPFLKRALNDLRGVWLLLNTAT